MGDITLLVAYDHRRAAVRARLAAKPPRGRPSTHFLPLNAQVLRDKMMAAHQEEVAAKQPDTHLDLNATEERMADHYSLPCV
jgi:hypothetical protein